MKPFMLTFVPLPPATGSSFSTSSYVTTELYDEDYGVILLNVIQFGLLPVLSYLC